MRLIERTSYLSQLEALRGTPDIKIITGMRRSGKSELVKAFIERCQGGNSKINVIFVSFSDLQFEFLKEYHKLHDFVVGAYRGGVENLLIIDEVQLCPKFELAINSLYEQKKFDIYLTGSNAFLLSSDLATLFTGRFVELTVYPFSFREFCAYWTDLSDKDMAFDEYVRVGGLAGSYLYANERQRVAYLTEVFTTIVKRDLVEKYKLSNELALMKLSDFLMDNIGNLTTVRKVAEALVRNDVATSHVTVGKYVDYLCKAFLFKPVRRYDVRGKSYLATNEKYYLYDTGLRFALLGARNLDFGRVYENLVYIELLRRGYEVYVGKLYEKEIDFVALRGSEKVYIQVSDDISSKETFARELEPLKRIGDAYPKWIIARTRHPTYDQEGIVVYDIVSWLSDEPIVMSSLAERILKRTEAHLRQAYRAVADASGQGEIAFDYGGNAGRFEIRGGGTAFDTRWSACGPDSVYAYKDGVRLLGFLQADRELPEQVDRFDAYDFTHRSVMLKVGDVCVFLNRENRFLGVKVIAVESRVLGVGRESLRIRYKIYPS